MAPREKPPTQLEQLEVVLAAVEVVSSEFPGSVYSENLPYGEASVRCSGHVVGQTGRIPCGNTVDPKRGSVCEDPLGCRREGRANGYAGA